MLTLRLPVDTGFVDDVPELYTSAIGKERVASAPGVALETSQMATALPPDVGRETKVSPPPPPGVAPFTVCVPITGENAPVSLAVSCATAAGDAEGVSTWVPDVAVVSEFVVATQTVAFVGIPVKTAFTRVP